MITISNSSLKDTYRGCRCNIDTDICMDVCWYMYLHIQMVWVMNFYTIYLNFHMKCVCDEKESEWVCKCVQVYIYMRECWKFIGPTKKPFPYLVKFQEVCCLAMNFSVPSHIHMHECVYMHILYVYYVYVFILFVSQDLSNLM